MTAVTTDQLLERENELTAIGDRLVDAAEGRGSTVVLEAPPGLGKSALAAGVAATAADQGFVVLRAAGHELEQGLGWGVARSLFESWLYVAGDRADLLDGPASPARALFEPTLATASPAADVSFGILHGLYWLAVRISEWRPLLLVVDDAHWADEPSLRFVHYLQGRLAEHRIVMLVATREDVGLPHASVRELAPLSATAVAELVRRGVDAPDELCERCFALSRGNPLQVRELVAAIQQDGSDDVDAIAERAARSLSRSVLRRLGSLSADAQALARAVAVFDHEIALHQAAELAEIAPHDALAAADELACADILIAGETLAFAHPLLRAAVYRSLSHSDRAVTHRRAATVLETHGAAREQVAAHLLKTVPAGDDGVVRGLRRAAHDAMAHGVPESALRYLERALKEPPADGARPHVLADLGRAGLVVGRRDALAHLEAAIPLIEDPVQRARVRLELGRGLHDFGRLSDSCDVLLAGLEEAGHADRDLRLLLEAAYLASSVALPDRAAGAHRRIGAILASASPEPTCSERSLLAKAMMMRVYSHGPREDVAGLARRLLSRRHLFNGESASMRVQSELVIALQFCDEYDAASEALARAFAFVRQGGSVTWHAVLSALQGRQRGWTGPIPDAIADARAAVDVFDDGLHLYMASASSVLVRALLEHDDPDAAEEVLARLDAGPPPVGPFVAWRHEIIGRIAAHRGDHERALEAFLACGEAATRVLVTNPGLFHWRSEAGIAALRLGRRDEATELIQKECELAERFRAPRAIGVALRAAALLQRGEAAVELLRSAAVLHEDCGARVEHAHTLTELGGAIRRAGVPGEARTVLRDAIRIADETGARAAGRRAREELVRAGGRAPNAGESTGDLTPSERRVAELAAGGRTNREIANELFVTVKAVEWHLGNVYRKLDVRGRRQLVGAL
ncbi:MAG TPA: AAA family ATPase [Solirubrobacteraceae bacterium]|nr:AAA family ATPase [Solirubrobacteraceae bacterium]